MATSSFSTRLRQDTDALFREWGAEFSAALAAIGLVQTADTGQINWTTVTRAAANSNAGYEIWRFNDALQGTAPIYIRFDYGSNSVQAAPRIQVTVGTGSNGTGTITGTALTTARSMLGANGNTYNSDVTIPSYFCFKDGHLGIAWKTSTSAAGTTTGVSALFMISRTVDSAGAADATGAIVVWGASTSASLTATQALRFAATATAFTAATQPSQTALGFFAQAQAASTVSGDNQFALGFTWTPRMQPLLSPIGVIDTEVAVGATFTATPVGTAPRTYIGLSGINGPFGPAALSAGVGLPKFAMLWEV